MGLGDEEHGMDSISDDGMDEKEKEEEIQPGQALNDERRKRRHEEEGKGELHRQPKVMKRLDSKYYKPPTLEELNALKEIEHLYHSSLFKLQMQELLNEVSMKESHKLKFFSWLVHFKKFVQNLKPSKEKLISLNALKKDFPNPLPKFGGMKETLGKFCFQTPDEISTVGSFSHGTIICKNRVLDVMLVAPVEKAKKLMRNFGWVVYRVLYLSHIAKHLLKNENLVSEVSWTLHVDTPLHPVLQVKPSGKLGRLWKVNIHVVPPAEQTDYETINPSQCMANFPDSTGQTPTPLHNWVSGLDVVMKCHNDFITKTLSQPHIVSGIKLLKVWLYQRNLHLVNGSISGHVITMYVVHLLKKRKLSYQMSPYQVFRTTLLQIVQTDWQTVGVSAAPLGHSEEETTLSEFRKIYDVIFVDPTGHFNLTALVPETAYRELQREAQNAIDLLSNSFSNCFEALFIFRPDFLLAYDQIAYFRLAPHHHKKLADRDKPEKYLDVYGDLRQPAFGIIIRILANALGTRVHLLSPRRESFPTWKVNEKPLAPSCDLVLGLLLNQSEAYSLLTKGPPGNAPEAKEFRKFWGNLSTLRRFADGTFQEAVIWGSPDSRASVRRDIPRKIICHIAENHLKLSPPHIAGTQLESGLLLGNKECGTGEEENLNIIMALTELSKKIRALELPLSITGIYPTCDVLRYSHTFPPKPITQVKSTTECEMASSFEKLPDFIPGIEVIITLRYSGKWPLDSLAVKAIKAEFYITIGALLKKSKIRSYVFPDNLKVVWKGYVFVFRVVNPDEVKSLRLVKDGKFRYREENTPASLEFQKNMIVLPQISSSLASIHGLNSNYGASVRLARRWAASQLLLNHLPLMAVELLMAHVFLSPEPLSPPASPQAAFLRFLYLLSSTHWKTTPLFINFARDIMVEDKTEILKRFMETRAEYPPMFICTPFDIVTRTHAQETPDQLHQRLALVSAWTRLSPDEHMLGRIVLVASVTRKYIEENLLTTAYDEKLIFRPSLTDYDILIYLRAEFLNRRYQCVDSDGSGVNGMAKEDKEKRQDWRKRRGSKTQCEGRVKPNDSRKSRITDSLPPVQHDHAQYYLQELKAAYDHCALFFYDEHGGNVIGVVWKPHVNQEMGLKMSELHGHEITGVREPKLAFNQALIMEDFMALGEGLVDHIFVQKS